jgi:sporadic carbohydrate cluster protein (TIGR04323 family)
MKLSLRGYIFSRSFMGERVPQHIQNIIIKDYCDKNNFNYLLSATEYTMKNSHSILEKIIDDIKSCDGIVFYSLFQLPENNILRKEKLELILKKKKLLAFACERILVSNFKDIKRIEDIWFIKKIIPRCELVKI